MVKNYSKLVRDLIPEIIEDDGKWCITEVLDDAQFLAELNKKLQEEVDEYLESGSLEELADILEVIDGILIAKGESKETLTTLKVKKRAERGGFEKKVYLKEVISDGGV